MQTPHVVKTREEILDAIQGDGSDFFDRTVDSYAKRSRLKIRSDLGYDPIRTVNRVGYCWDDGTVVKMDAPDSNAKIWCDTGRRLVVYGDRHSKLTNMEFRICAMLSLRPGVIKSRLQFSNALHSDRRPASERVIDSSIKRARKQLVRDLGFNPIRTSYGFGYYWENPPH
jgi:DNA-binding response OmpR family regulator